MSKTKVITQQVNINLVKSSFKYWFTHWCAYQMTAILLGEWRCRHLLHDIEKPFLKLFLPYHKVRNIHRKYSRHHIEHPKVNYLDLVIDWECSQHKPQESLNARNYLNYMVSKNKIDIHHKNNIENILDKLGL